MCVENQCGMCLVQNTCVECVECFAVMQHHRFHFHVRAVCTEHSCVSDRPHKVISIYYYTSCCECGMIVSLVWNGDVWPEVWSCLMEILSFLNWTHHSNVTIIHMRVTCPSADPMLLMEVMHTLSIFSAISQCDDHYEWISVHKTRLSSSVSSAGR
jgi:hypothetical protein